MTLIEAAPDALSELLVNDARPTVLVTGAAGNLGRRLLPQLAGFRAIGVDVRQPEEAWPGGFYAIDLGLETSFRQMLELLRETQPAAVVHLAFVVDQVRNDVVNVDRMWRINVAGTARVAEAVGVLNSRARPGPVVQKFIFPSSVSAYGPELVGEVKEDCPLAAHTLPYAVHKREADIVMQNRVATLGECRTYILRPHIFAGPTVENYIVGALRGTPTGTGKRAAKWRERGKRLPILLPRGRRYLQNRMQFVQVDDMARLIAHILRRSERDPLLTILNVAGKDAPLTVEQAAQIAGRKITQVPTRLLCRFLLRLAWKRKISAFPPEAFPYLTGSQVMDTARLREFLGSSYDEVIRFSNAEALRSCFPSANHGDALPA
jgi:nucleoside-diphosphate-sugar epimerase